MLIFPKQINIQAFKKITIPRTFTACLKTCSENFIATDIGFKNSFLKMLWDSIIYIFLLYLKGTNVNQNMGRHCKEIQWKRVELSIIFTKNMFCIFSFLIIAIIIYRELSSSLSRISGRCMWMPSPSSYDSFGNMVRYSLYRIALEEFYFNHKKRSLHVNSENLNTLCEE